MIYFDNAATSFPKPAVVSEAMAKFLAEDAANPGRAGHRMAVKAEQMLDDVRLKLTRLINGPDPHRLVFAMNGTDALNMAIKGVISELEEGTPGSGQRPHVITTVLEHNSVSRPLQAMASRGQIDLTRVRCDAAGFVDPDDIRKAITSATQLVAVTHASNVLGTIQDAAAIGRIAREHDLLFLLDAAQTIGVVPIDVDAMSIDLLAFPGHKSLLGPTGTGALYVGQRCPEPAEAVAATHEAGHIDQQISRKRKLQPWREGGTGGDSATPTQPTLYPYYLEGGTPNTVGIAGLGAALDEITPEAMARTLAHEQAHCAKLIDRFAYDDRFTVYGPRDATKCVGTLSINVEGFEPSDIGSILDDSFDIAVRPGLHCAPYAHRQLDTFPSGALRISPGPYNTDEQLDQLIDALDQIVG